MKSKEGLGASPTRPRAGSRRDRPYKSRGGLFPCDRCPASYDSTSSLGRHFRQAHKPGFKCSEDGCDNYKWFASRKAEHIEHLKNNHRLNDNEIESRLTRQRVESDLPPSPPTDVYHASPPLIQSESVAHNPRLEYGDSSPIQEHHEIHDQQFGFVILFLSGIPY
jgi:hypothetical protein